MHGRPPPQNRRADAGHRETIESSADGDEETLGTDEELPMGDSEEATEVDATDDEESEDEE
jgi:hypothetical protein